MNTNRKYRQIRLLRTALVEFSKWKENPQNILIAFNRLIRLEHLLTSGNEEELNAKYR